MGRCIILSNNLDNLQFNYIKNTIIIYIMEPTAIAIIYSFVLGFTIFYHVPLVTSDDDLDEIEPIPITNHTLSR